MDLKVDLSAAGPKMTVAQPMPWLQPVGDPEVEHPAKRCPDSCPREAGRIINVVPLSH